MPEGPGVRRARISIVPPTAGSLKFRAVGTQISFLVPHLGNDRAGRRRQGASTAAAQRGPATFLGSGSVVVTLPVALPDANYNVTVSTTGTAPLETFHGHRHHEDRLHHQFIQSIVYRHGHVVLELTADYQGRGANASPPPTRGYSGSIAVTAIGIPPFICIDESRLPCVSLRVEA